MEEILKEISSSLIFIRVALSIIIGIKLGELVGNAMNKPQMPEWRSK